MNLPSRTKAPMGSWVHAHLHRKEDDQGNASHWYSRAGKPICRKPLEMEWITIVKHLLGQIDLCSGDYTLAGRKDFTSQPRVTLGIAKMFPSADNLTALEFPIRCVLVDFR